MPELTMNSERLVGILEKSIMLMDDPSIAFNLHDNAFGITGYHEGLRTVFEGGRSLFFGEVIQCVIRLRTMETDFGVIPYPKYDETQENYGHYVNGVASVLSVPITNTELERTGVIIEALTAKSMYTLKNAYYDVCLEGKFMRDDDSKEMLDIILATRNYDIGYIHNWGNLFDSFRSCIKNGSTDFASAYVTKESAAIQQMEKTIDAWLSIE